MEPESLIVPVPDSTTSSAVGSAIVDTLLPLRLVIATEPSLLAREVIHGAFAGSTDYDTQTVELASSDLSPSRCFGQLRTST